VSRWLPDCLEITLAPDHLMLARSPHRLALGGGRRAYPPASVVPVPPAEDGAPAWGAALAALGEVLQDLDAHAMGPAVATVILANRYVRYALVPWSDLVDDEEEEAQALARHYLQESFGAAAERWELRIAPDPQAPQRLVSAVEPGLLADLRQLFAASPIRLASIQPRLMAVCNRHRRRLGQRDAWLALAEPGALCLLLLQGGRAVRLRQLRLGDAWPSELVTSLERESYVVESPVPIQDVFLAADGMEDQSFPPARSWNIQLIESAPPAAAVAPAGIGPALAVGG